MTFGIILGGAKSKTRKCRRGVKADAVTDQTAGPEMTDLIVLEFDGLENAGLDIDWLSEEISWEERLQNDLFCVEWDVKP